MEPGLDAIKRYVDHISTISTSQGPMGLTQGDRDLIALSFAAVRADLDRLRKLEAEACPPTS
ncbi:MAG: hypothetical protein IT364_24595 [Candidatus Hydrogenedentes bacterium]|nr:hypothetical protein [Candidatus Hydrogenedentota bacterium]